MTNTIAVHVRQQFAAPPTLVFDAWLDPETLGRWMFRTVVPDETIVRLQTDPRVGGSFSFVVLRQGQEIDHVGEYLEFDRPRRLVFTWSIRANLPETSRVAIEISPRDSGCELSLTHEIDPQWSDFAPRIQQSWTTMLTSLCRQFV